MATFTNVATLSYNGNVTNSNTVSGTINETLTASKTALPESYNAGDEITYVISLINSGNAPLNSISVSDNLGVYEFSGTTLVPLTYREGSIRYFIDGVLQTTPPETDIGTDLVFSGITVPANGNSTIIYQATVNQYAPLGVDGAITNIATINGAGLTTIEVSETITATNDPRLAITKSLSPTIVTENSEITYTFVIQNFGSTAVEEGSDIVLSDTFDPVLTNITVTLNGVVFGTENYNYDEVTGVFTTTPGSISIPAATVEQLPDGTFVSTPGETTLVITGTI